MSAHLNRRHVISLIAGCALGSARSTESDPANVTARVERLPRAQRLGAYEAALADPSLPAADRQVLIKAFARHAQQVSPFYSRGPFPFNPSRWTELLRSGFDPRKPDIDVALALAQLFIDSGDLPAALPIVTAFKAAAPSHHNALAWDEWCSKREPGRPSPGAGALLEFPVHFVVVTRAPGAQNVATLDQCRKECDILNATMRALDGKQLVRFAYKSFTPYSISQSCNSQLVSLADTAGPFPSNKVMEAFNACRDPRIRDPRAINVYIFDSRSDRAGAEDVTSHGRRNSNRPYVFLDWQRLDNKTQNAEAHEMGHAFGLEHVGVPGAAGRTSTNIMTSAAEGFGSGGLRDLGFTPAQAALVGYHARRTYSRLGLGR